MIHKFKSSHKVKIRIIILVLITLEHLILSFGHFPSKWNQLERQETKDKYSYIPGQCMYLHTYQYTTDSVVACQQNNMHFWCSRWVTLAKSPDRFKSAAFESFTLIYDTYIWFFFKKKILSHRNMGGYSDLGDEPFPEFGRNITFHKDLWCTLSYFTS